MESIKKKLEEEKKIQNNFAKIQAEKNFFLGEYKERVLGALTKDQLLKDDVYPEIITLMEKPEAFLLKLSRDVEIKKLKPYIHHAEEVGLKNQLVDGLSYKGNIGLVIVSKDALDGQSENLIIRDMDQDFIDAGLGETISKSRGLSICAKHYNEIKKKLPNYINDFKKIGLLGKFIGNKCPICTAEKENRRK